MDRWITAWRRSVRGTAWRRALSDAVAVTAVGLFALGIGMGPVVSDAPVTGGPGWWHIPPLLIGALVMLGKHRHPVAMLTLGVLVFAADLAIGGSLGVLLVLIDLLYTLALVGSERAVRRLFMATAMIIAGSTVLAWAIHHEVRAGLWMGLQAFAILATPVWWGTSVRRQKELADLASARADDLARIASMQQEEALRDERERMARDLHDAVAGNLSAIALYAEAGLNRSGGASAHTGIEHRSLAQIRSSSVTALTEMRTMIGLLRGGRPERSPARISDLEAVRNLVAGHGGTLERSGAAATLPTAVDQTAYRILQESLTNASKHGTGPPQVRLLAGEQRLELEVRNQIASDAVPGQGLGVDILAERADAVGGVCVAGPREGTWTVRAVLPMTGRAS
ncbi:sensor histidine kinase [Ruania halotolerans]|uniref:sensor histidine kinase n=1 Tax=Ruania halotolerans TaxID=2897773 RepID=UPI001E31B30B|nr:histidine kinase [Ruania halotolerans]UFU06867.1 histidine kinase [Ruania halotolerans]